MQAGILGIVDRDRIIDGAAAREGDALLALASNGLHTNGYSLVRKLMEAKPAILDEIIDGRSFLEAIMMPHMSYSAAVKMLVENYFDAVRGMAHITGGGMRDNLIRILHGDNLRAEIDLPSVRVPRIFGVIKKYANTSDEDMLRTFNNGVGMVLIVDGGRAAEIAKTLADAGAEAYEIGRIGKGPRDVVFNNAFNWGV